MLNILCIVMTAQSYALKEFGLNKIDRYQTKNETLVESGNIYEQSICGMKFYQYETLICTPLSKAKIQE